MARFQPIDYNQDLLLSVTLAKQLVPGSFEWAVHQLIEGLLNNSFSPRRMPRSVNFRVVSSEREAFLGPLACESSVSRPFRCTVFATNKTETMHLTSAMGSCSRK